MTASTFRTCQQASHVIEAALSHHCRTDKGDGSRATGCLWTLLLAGSGGAPGLLLLGLGEREAGGSRLVRIISADGELCRVVVGAALSAVLLPFAVRMKLCFASCSSLENDFELRYAIGQVLLSLGAGAVSVLFFSSTVAAFRNVPDHVPISVAFGSEAKSTYLKAALRRRQNWRRQSTFIAASGSWRSRGGRHFCERWVSAIVDWTPEWEFESLLTLRYKTPTKDPEVVRQRWASEGVRWLVLDLHLRLTSFMYSEAIRFLVRDKSELRFMGPGQASSCTDL